MDITQSIVCQLIQTWAGKQPGPFVAPEGVSAESVQKLLVDHNVEAAMATVLPTEYMDEQFAERIQQSQDRTTFLLLELERLLPAITFAGCQPVVLKGAGLAQTLYSDPGQRWFIDLDILVLRQDVDEVCRRLETIGYKSFSGNRDPEFYEKYHLHRMMLGPQGSCLEIHWDLTVPNSVYSFDVEGVFKRAQKMSLGSITTLTASPVDQLFHGVYQNIADGYLDLRRILDFVLLMDAMSTEDWLYIMKESGRVGMAQALALSLHIVKEVSGVEPPAQFSGEFKLSRTNARIFHGLNVTAGCLSRRGEQISGYSTMIHLLLTPNCPNRFRELYLYLIPNEASLMDAGHWGSALPGFKVRSRHMLYHLKILTLIGGRTARALAKG